jgi:hypothetical protein
MKDLRSFFLLLFSISVFAGSPVVHSASFTADAVQTRGENVSRAKMYWLDGNVRFEYMEDGVPMVQIFDNKNNKIIWLDSKNNYYLEREMPLNEQHSTAEKNKKTIDPCKQFIGADCVLLKKVNINGRAAEKWLITLDNNGSDFHIFQWIDVKYKSILRQENSDGTGLNVDIVDDQEINGRKVRKLTMVAYSVKGKQEGVQWYDNELDIVVKQQYENDVVDELQNIKVGKVSKSLFTIPEGYTLYDAVDKAMTKETAAKVIDNK